MKKIIIYGLGSVFANYMRILAELAKNDEIIIEAAVDRNFKDDTMKVLSTVNVVKKEELLSLHYDTIVIFAIENNYKSILEDLKQLGISKEKCVPVNLFVEEYSHTYHYYAKQREVQLSIISELLHATEAEITDYEWMLKRVRQYGIHCCVNDWRKEEKTTWIPHGMLQVPEEFAKYCCMLSTFEDIKTALEVGVYRGLSSYFMCAVLSRKNPDLIYHMVDIVDALEDYERFSELLPALKKCIPSTSKDYEGQKFDFVFIDADHSYDASIADYDRVGQYANAITVFHDIYAHEYDEENGGTVRMWKEVRERVEKSGEKIIKEFTKYPDQWMGIGCVIEKGKSCDTNL